MTDRDSEKPENWNGVDRRRATHDQLLLRALTATYATIEFTPDGMIKTANKNFLAATGYDLEDIQGKHHRIFMPPEEVHTRAYAQFWDRIGNGETFSGTFLRKRKDGSDLWILATYTPVYDHTGKLASAFKLAVDVTADKKGQAAVVDGMRALARRDMAHRMPTNLGGDYAEAAKAFNGTMAQLGNVLEALNVRSDQLENTGQGLSQDAEALRNRAGGLAHAISETRGGVHELTTSVRDIAGYAAETETVVNTAGDRSQEAASVMADAVDCMQSLDRLTKDITRITKVIEGFATQTNMLSINAAVEAARAGTAGQGFAVVATEVRTLAERSAKASGEIDALIERSAKEVERGVDLVRNAGDALSLIQKSVGDASRQCERITSDTQTQSQEMDRINRTLESMTEDTQDLSRVATSNGEHAVEMEGAVASLRGAVDAFLQPVEQGAGRTVQRRSA